MFAQNTELCTGIQQILRGNLHFLTKIYFTEASANGVPFHKKLRARFVR